MVLQGDVNKNYEDEKFLIPVIIFNAWSWIGNDLNDFQLRFDFG